MDLALVRVLELPLVSVTWRQRPPSSTHLLAVLVRNNRARRRTRVRTEANTLLLSRVAAAELEPDDSRTRRRR